MHDTPFVLLGERFQFRQAAEALCCIEPRPGRAIVVNEAKKSNRQTGRSRQVAKV